MQLTYFVKIYIDSFIHLYYQIRGVRRIVYITMAPRAQSMSSVTTTATMPKPEATMPPPVETKEEFPPVVVNGNPPWHSVAMMGICISLFLQQLLTSSSNNTTDASSFSHVLFPTILPLKAVIAIRLLVASIIFADLFRASMLCVCLDHRSEYYPGSLLKAGAPIEYHGALTNKGSLWSGFLGVASFTMVTWFLEGCFFFLAGILPLLHPADASIVTSSLASMASTLWEIVCPCAFLITLVVTFVLWPFAIEARKQGHGEGQIKMLKGTSLFQGPLLAHNLNVLAIAMELSLLGGVTIRPDHFAMAPLYGCGYVLFAWSMKDSWLPQLTKEEQQSWGPQFLYPFLDTTQGWNTTYSLLALLTVLFVSHWGVYGLHTFLSTVVSPDLYYNGDTAAAAVEQNMWSVDGWYTFLSSMIYAVEEEVEDDDTTVLRFAGHCGVVLMVFCLLCRFK